MSINKCRAVCFDMDGTLITNTNSVEYLCILNGKADVYLRTNDLFYIVEHIIGWY